MSSGADEPVCKRDPFTGREYCDCGTSAPVDHVLPPPLQVEVGPSEGLRKLIDETIQRQIEDREHRVRDALSAALVMWMDTPEYDHRKIMVRTSWPEFAATLDTAINEAHR